MVLELINKEKDLHVVVQIANGTKEGIRLFLSPFTPLKYLLTVRMPR